MIEFAKIFSTEEHGQVLAMMDTDSDGNKSIVFRFVYYAHGICEFNVGFASNEELMMQSFSELSKLTVCELISGVKLQIKEEGKI